MKYRIKIKQLIYGVPKSYIAVHNADQFNIIGVSEDSGIGYSDGLFIRKGLLQPLIDGHKKFSRIFIRKIVDN